MKARYVTAIVILLSTTALSALEVPPLSAPVTDLAGLLAAEHKEQLDALLLDYEAQTSNQFAVLIIPSLEGEDLESYSIRVATEWALGQAGKDNGLLLLVALEQRRLRIEVGYGLEGVLTDAFCGRVIDNTIVPYFKQGEYYEGITAGLLALIRQTGDEFGVDPALEPAAERSQLSGRSGAYVFLSVLFVMVLIVSIFLGRNRAFSQLYKKKYEGLRARKVSDLGMDPRLYRVWSKRVKKQLKGRISFLAFFGLIPILPSLSVIPMTRLALIVPGLYLFAFFLAPLLFRPRELPYALSYRKVVDEYGKLEKLMAEVQSEEERRQMLKLFLAGYISVALMRMVIQRKGHFDSQFFKSSYRSSSSGAGSGSSFSGGGGSFGGGGASGGW
jgi:uncharacterized protein